MPDQDAFREALPFVRGRCHSRHGTLSQRAVEPNGGLAAKLAALTPGNSRVRFASPSKIAEASAAECPLAAGSTVNAITRSG